MTPLEPVTRPERVPNPDKAKLTVYRRELRRMNKALVFQHQVSNLMAVQLNAAHAETVRQMNIIAAMQHWRRTWPCRWFGRHVWQDTTVSGTYCLRCGERRD